VGETHQPLPLGRRGTTVLAIALAGAAAWWLLGLSAGDLAPTAGGLRLTRDFFAAAVHPTLTYESGLAPVGSQSFGVTILQAVARTVTFAAAALSLAIVAGLPLGFFSSSSWWVHESLGRRPALRALALGLQAVARLLAACMRSVHELLWAVVFLAAFGLNTASAVIAIAIPYAGTLAKVYSEMLDEAPAEAAAALRAAGAGPGQVFAIGLFPRALPDMAAYSFYRLECAVRSSAVLGFFGYQTIGYYLRASFENLHYREVWTWLYVLLGLVLLLEAWSAALRRRFVA
jgi:phosphonate transport system permease protein